MDIIQIVVGRKGVVCGRRGSMRLRRRASPPFSLLAKKIKRAAGRSKREEPESSWSVRCRLASPYRVRPT